ncbi:calphotin-like isoform X2 [Penaeus japonicus]|uniref:calphotin-like isoform X2 n=1 Tax=Penaeus japonicus TaxID=27405 RepID=UPI001C714E81|nr:calphotin-like isoform X2 [Penaeus japonicus]
MNFLTVLCLTAVAASCSAQVPTLPGIFGAFPGLYHGLFPKHPSFLRYGHTRSSPGIWQTFVQSAPQGTVAHHAAVAAPVTLKSHVPTQFTIRPVSSLPLYLNTLANNHVLLQTPAQSPVTLKVAAPSPAGTAAFTPVVLKATSDSLKVGDPNVVHSLSATPVGFNVAPAAPVVFKAATADNLKVVDSQVVHSLSPIAPVIFKAADPDKAEDKDAQTVSFRTSDRAPAFVQAVAPATVAYSVAAPTPVKIEGAVPAPVIHQALPSPYAPLTVANAPAQLTVGAPTPVAVAAAAPAHLSVAGAAPAHLSVAGAAPAHLSVAGAAPAHLSVAGAAPAHLSVAGAAPAHLSVAGATPVTLNAAPAAAIAGVQSQYHAQDEIGQYSFGYYNSQSSRAETRDASGTVRGAFSYVDPNGQVQTQHYVADSKGFRVAGTNLPVGPGTQVVGRHPHLNPGTPLVYSSLPYTAGAAVAGGTTLQVSPGSPLVYSNLPVAFGSPVVAVEKPDDTDDDADED